MFLCNFAFFSILTVTIETVNYLNNAQLLANKTIIFGFRRHLYPMINNQSKVTPHHKVVIKKYLYVFTLKSAKMMHLCKLDICKLRNLHKKYILWKE